MIKRSLLPFLFLDLATSSPSILFFLPEPDWRWRKEDEDGDWERRKEIGNDRGNDFGENSPQITSLYHSSIDFPMESIFTPVPSLTPFHLNHPSLESSLESDDKRGGGTRLRAEEVNRDGSTSQRSGMERQLLATERSWNESILYLSFLTLWSLTDMTW